MLIVFECGLHQLLLTAQCTIKVSTKFLATWLNGNVYPQFWPRLKYLERLPLHFVQTSY